MSKFELLIANNRDLGGDAVEARLLAERLRQMGVDVGVRFGGEVSQADAYYVVNSLDLTALSRIQRGMGGTPYVWLPIHHDFQAMSRYLTDRLGLPFSLPASAWPAMLTARYGGVVGRPFLSVTRAFGRGAAAIVVRTQREAASLERDLGLVPDLVIPPSLPSGCVAPQIQRDIDVLVVGRIEPLKNQVRVVRALSDAEGLEICVVGAESDRHRGYAVQLRNAAARSQAHVTLTGALPPAETAKLYRRAKVVVIASLFESFSLVALEAITSGCRLAVSDAVGALDVIEGQSRVFNPYDIWDMKQAIILALKDPGRARVNFQLDYERQANSVLQALIGAMK